MPVHDLHHSVELSDGGERAPPMSEVKLIVSVDKSSATIGSCPVTIFFRSPGIQDCCRSEPPATSGTSKRSVRCTEISRDGTEFAASDTEHDGDLNMPRTVPTAAAGVRETGLLRRSITGCLRHRYTNCACLLPWTGGAGYRVPHRPVFAREGAFFCSLFPCPVSRPPTPPPRAHPVGSPVELPAPQQYSPWARD